MQVNLDKIVRGCKAKEQKAFELMYTTCYRVLFGIAFRYSPTKSEDILEDSFIKTFNSIESVSGKGSFEKWMKHIVQNTAMNSYCSHLKFDLQVAISEQINVAESRDFEAFLQSFDANDVGELFNQLPEGYKLVINLFYIDGYSHKEISEMLHISVGTLKSQLYKAKANLKTLVELQLNQQVV
jgi:RNA polymerase sigma factor (sigma-70 family)